MLLSRTADALYWISRYLERAEHTARLIDVRLDLGLDRTADGWQFDRLYASLRLKPPDEPVPGPAELVEALIFDLSNRDSVASCVTAARDNARQVREEISQDMWEQVNGLYLRLREAHAEGTWAGRPHYLCRMVIEGVHLFQGVTDATMGHGEGWQYLQTGRFLERADATAALLDLHFKDTARAAGGTADHSEWVGLLRSCSALEAYCRCYTAELRRERIAEFLLLNSEFPRSVRFAAAGVESALRGISQPDGARRGRASGAPGGSAARLARLRPGGRDPERRSARLSRGHRTALRADPRRRASVVHRLPHRGGAARVALHVLHIRHTTRFTYESPISESVMEARMQPRSEAAQRCIHFGLSTTPALARDDVPGSRRQHRPPLQYSRTPRPADGDGAGARREPRRQRDSREAEPRRLGAARRPRRRRRVLGRHGAERVRALNAAPGGVLEGDRRSSAALPIR